MRLIAIQDGGRIAGTDQRAGVAAGQSEIDARLALWVRRGAGAVELDCEDRLRIVGRSSDPCHDDHL